MSLGVNVDHVATLRQARRARQPDPVAAAILCEEAGADQITVHLREDRRHIQDRDVRLLRDVVRTRLNLEMAATDEMVEIARSVRPHTCTLVPEKREELTTEGGLDVLGRLDEVRGVIRRLRDEGIRVSLFVDPDEAQIDACRDLGADAVEITTGAYSEAGGGDVARELARVERAADQALRHGLEPLAGHGLDYNNVGPIARIPALRELNIGHAIVAHSVSVGLRVAVREMVDLLRVHRFGAA
jgi:pyridoxine 5-phosphate synthase